MVRPWGRAVSSGFALLLTACAFGCINLYTTLLNGTVRYGDSEPGDCMVHGKHVDRTAIKHVLDSLDAAGRQHGMGPEDLNDRGVMLIYLGRYAEAVEQFRALRRSGFNSYTVNANLGTAFELMGENDSALACIRRAVAIDPASHEGSEWIHVKVLERKVALANGQATGPILGCSFGAGELPRAPERIGLEVLRSHLMYQLQERLTFVAPRDPVVAELLFELGNTQALLVNVECALDLYEQAAEYGLSTELFEARRSRLGRMTLKAKLLNAAEGKPARWMQVALYGGGLLVLVLLALLVRRWSRA